MARRLLKVGPAVETVSSPVVAKPRNKRQRGLQLDPMPDRVEPCLALLQSKPPEGDDWAFEVKWDGYRLAVHVEPGKVRVITRGGHDWTRRFPMIAHDVRELGLDTAILDGDAVVLDERGASDFGALQKALGGRGGKAFASSAILYAFDLLYLDGRDLRALPLDERPAVWRNVIGAGHSARVSQPKCFKRRAEFKISAGCYQLRSSVGEGRMERSPKGGSGYGAKSWRV